MTTERIIIAVLAFVLAIFIFKTCSRPSEEKEAERKEQYETQVAILQVEKATVQSRQDSLVQRYKEKVRADSLNLALQNQRIKALQTKLTNQRPKVIEKIQADTAVLSYVETLEEIVTELHVQNDTLKSVVEFQRKMNEDLISLEMVEDKIEAQMAIESSIRIADLERSTKKKERKSRFVKILVPVAAVASFLIGAQL